MVAVIVIDIGIFFKWKFVFDDLSSLLIDGPI